ncbi:hypothetical protein HPB49_014997 [Dermacentor silvarum]|uniref:Uncharacterized protein n=1 Tax=Dermacentor silvarum TaxID=543639 RepID=A0ACB8CFW0_DERSI|nr:hypothetical protein HPB49_014997 [Dermacentor silvarum]
MLVITWELRNWYEAEGALSLQEAFRLKNRPRDLQIPIQVPFSFGEANHLVQQGQGYWMIAQYIKAEGGRVKAQITNRDEVTIGEARPLVGKVKRKAPSPKEVSETEGDEEEEMADPDETPTDAGAIGPAVTTMRIRGKLTTRLASFEKRIMELFSRIEERITHLERPKIQPRGRTLASAEQPQEIRNLGNAEILATAEGEPMAGAEDPSETLDAAEATAEEESKITAERKRGKKRRGHTEDPGAKGVCFQAAIPSLQIPGHTGYLTFATLLAS